MAATRKSTKGTQPDTDPDGFTAEERSAIKERAKEMKATKGGKKVDGTAEVVEKIAAMADADRVLAERLHEIITKAAPELTPQDLVRVARLRAGRQGRRLLPGRGQVQGPLRDPRLPGRGEPRRRCHVADVVRADQADPGRRKADRRAGQEGGRLTIRQSRPVRQCHTTGPTTR
jgi:hypothetical protein